MDCVFLPVGDAEVSVVGEVAVVGSPPGDSSPGSTTDLTPEGDAFSAVACHITQRYEELWGNWRRGNSQWSGCGFQEGSFVYSTKV